MHSKCELTIVHYVCTYSHVMHTTMTTTYIAQNFRELKFLWFAKFPYNFCGKNFMDSCPLPGLNFYSASGAALI